MVLYSNLVQLNPNLFQVSLAFGLAVMAIASFTGHVSGGRGATMTENKANSDLVKAQLF